MTTDEIHYHNHFFSMSIILVALSIIRWLMYAQYVHIIRKKSIAQHI